jgi:hypothetical protein
MYTARDSYAGCEVHTLRYPNQRRFLSVAAVALGALRAQRSSGGLHAILEPVVVDLDEIPHSARAKK